MSLLKFKPNEKIFAKVRGYPPWPARVEGVADETPNKIKYHVYFYGTGETAVCKQEELFPYLENRDKFGKPMKKKGFNEALSQVDSELGLSPSMHPPQTPNDQDSEAEGSLIIDETPGKKGKSNTSTPTTTKVKEPKTNKRKANSIEHETSAKKPQKKSVSSSDLDSPAVSRKSTASEPTVISRSGRKIKPKKFSVGSDGETDEHETPKGRQISNRSSAGSQLSKSRNSGNKSDNGMELDAELINDSTLVAFTPKGEEVRLKLNLNKPRMFKSDKARLDWEAKVLEDGKTLKAQIESGAILPHNVKKEIQEKYQDKLIQLEHKMASDDKKEKLEYLKIEAQVLDIDVRIKSSLSLKQADPESCLKSLDELLSIQLNPLMVKKHPEVVDTVKKLRKYVGNTSSWNMSDEETLIFASKAASIRSKSEHVYNKIKSLFMVPYGQSFWDVFAKELKTFNDTIKGMETDDVFSLTNDPTDKEIDESEGHEQNSLDSSAA